MLDPNVTEILDDPEVGGGQPFTVVRRIVSDSILHGVTEEQQLFSHTGNVQPAGTTDLRQLAPEDQREPVIVIRSTFAFQLGQQSMGGQINADEVLYQEQRYKVVRVDHWTEWGFTIAYATMQKNGGAS